MKKFLLSLALIISFSSVPVFAISETQKTSIIERCDTVKENLKSVQHQDSRTRVYLGRYYETILSKYITPLNVRLVENNLFDKNLMDNQDSFSKTRDGFIIDYIEYQKGLEDLVAMDCKTEPEVFYEKLVKIREKRKIVATDVANLKKLSTSQVELVKKLKEKL